MDLYSGLRASCHRVDLATFFAVGPKKTRAVVLKYMLADKKGMLLFSACRKVKRKKSLPAYSLIHLCTKHLLAPLIYLSMLLVQLSV